MSKPELLAARKELLAMRAELQRMELAIHVDQAKASLSWAKALTGSIGGFLKTPKIGVLSSFMGHWFKNYPMLTTVGSMVFARLRKPIMRAGLRASLIAVVTGGVYWWIRRGSISARRGFARRAFDTGPVVVTPAISPNPVEPTTHQSGQ